MAITGTIALNVQLTEALAGDIEAGSLISRMLQSWDVAAGTGADQANLLWSDKRTLSSGATEALDFSGSLTALSGSSKVFAKLKAVIAYAPPTNTTNITISRPAQNGVPFLAAAGDAFTLGPGDFFLLTRRAAAGVTVTASSGDLIQVDNSAGASGDYYLLALGTDA